MFGHMFGSACCTEHTDKQQITDVSTVAGRATAALASVPFGIVLVRVRVRPHGQVAADSDGGRRAIIRRRRLPTVAGCAINDGDGDDMLWMQLVKVGNVFDRAKAPAWAQPSLRTGRRCSSGKADGDDVLWLQL